MGIARLAIAGLPAIAAVVVARGTATTGAASAAATLGIAGFAARVLLGFGGLARRLRQAGGFLLEVFRQRQRHQLHAGQLFDVAQVGLFIGSHQAQRDTIRPGARGAADAVDVLLGHIGHFEVEHVADTADVNAARGNVGGDQHRGGALAEGVQRGGALGLALVAMDGRSIDPGGAEVADHAVCAVLGAGEHQRAVNRLVGQPGTQLQRQQRLLFGLIDVGAVLLHPLCRGRLRGDFDADRVVDELLAQIGNCLGHGGREEQALAVLGQQVGNALQRHDKAKVHHLIGFIEHEDFDIAQRQRALIDQIEQAARRRDQNVAARNQRPRLLADGNAAENALDRKVQILGIAAHVFSDLGGQFAGGREHQHPARSGLAGLGIRGQTVQRRQRERGGLAGAGLGDAQNVAALQQRRNGLLLDRRGIGIALGFKRTKKRLGKAKVGKIGHGILSDMKRRARLLRPRAKQGVDRCDPA